LDPRFREDDAVTVRHDAETAASGNPLLSARE
jgi:hypothetical protein